MEAHLALDHGDPQRALSLVASAPARLGRLPAPTFRAMLATAASRAHLALGDLDAAGSSLSAAPDHAAVRWQRIAVALVARELPSARDLVVEWPAEPTPRSQVLRGLAEAMIAEGVGDHRAVEVPLAEATAIADAHHLVQPFVELVPRWPGLCRQAAKTSTSAQAALDLATDPAGTEGLLSAAELSVMDHLGSDATLADIAQRLHLSVNTVKTHVRHIYRKLDARSRSEATARWRTITAHPPLP